MGESRNLYLLTGSNLGDREALLQQARTAIADQIGHIAKASGLYETQPWGLREQPDFLNQALLVHTQLLPPKVLEVAKSIEKTMGRKTVIRWGERLIDIDLLFYDAIIFESERLIIPHPRVQDRNFALAPLAEIAPDLRHPVLGKTVAELLKIAPDGSRVVRL